MTTARSNNFRRRGSVMIIAMVIVFAITALVLTLNRQAYTQAQAAANDYSSQQADAIERGAEQYAMGILAQNRDTLPQQPETDFSAVPLGGGYFWFIRPNYNDTTLPQFGLLDESTKLNLNTVSANALAAMPAVPIEVAGAIIDWRDTDENPSTNGAESSTYLSTPEPYQAKNGPFESVDEMLLLNGMSRTVMYGDPLSQASTAPGDYYLGHGIGDYFTIWSTQSTLAPDGTQRISVSTASQRPQLQQKLIDVLGQQRGAAIYQRAFSQQNAASVTDIFSFATTGRLTTDEFTQIEDYITSRAATTTPATPPADPTLTADAALTTTTTGMRGQINVNTAPREVMMALTGVRGSLLSEGDIDALIANRPGSTAIKPQSLAWVFEALGQKASGLGRYICGRGDQYSADIVAVSRNGRGFRHVRVVVDMASGIPRIVFRHDISDHGWPLDPQILVLLKAGQELTPGASVMPVGGMH